MKRKKKKYNGTKLLMEQMQSIPADNKKALKFISKQAVKHASHRCINTKYQVSRKGINVIFTSGSYKDFIKLPEKSKDVFFETIINDFIPQAHKEGLEYKEILVNDTFGVYIR